MVVLIDENQTSIFLFSTLSLLVKFFVFSVRLGHKNNPDVGNLKPANAGFRYAKRSLAEKG